MPTLKAAWLPGGSVDLAPLPYKGDRELKELAARDADIEAIFTQFKFIALSQALLHGKRIIDSLGAAKAKESWDEFLVAEFDGLPEFIWPIEMFEENFLALRTRILNQQLMCGSDEDAALKLAEMAKATGEAAKGIDKAALGRVAQRPLIALYWRLRASGVKEIITPAGRKTVDWDLEKRDAAIDLLAEVATAEDVKAMDEKPKRRPVDMEDFKPLSVADVQGKSETSSEPTIPLRPSLERSSTVSDGPGKSPTSQ